MEAVGASDPARCVYVGDRLFDDIWGAHNAGLKAIHIPHSAIPVEQVGHSEGEPDAVAHELAEIPGAAGRASVVAGSAWSRHRSRPVESGVASAAAAFDRDYPLLAGGAAA